jgi:hypothetical protein
MKTRTSVISSLAALALAIPAASAFAGQKQEAGSFDAAYVKRDVQPIAEGHILLLAESTGINKGGGKFDGFAVSVRDILDLDQGNGPDNGYLFLSQGGDMQVVQISGKATTVMKDGHPNTTLAGNWKVVNASGGLAGSRGEGTYSGYFTAEDKYHIDWKGWLDGPAATASRN